MHLLLIRHAETGHNRDSRVQGQADIPLSDLGMRQAAALGAYLQHESFTTIIASPLARALATAQAVARYHDVPVSVEPDLMEMHVGDMEGLSTVEMRDRFPEFLAEWVTERGPALQMPRGESLIQVQQRVWAVVERLHKRDRDARVALISHNFVLSAL